jgi:hypothetical protein
VTPYGRCPTAARRARRHRRRNRRHRPVERRRPEPVHPVSGTDQHANAYTETCAWPGCLVAISWRHAFCYRHWKKIPTQDRDQRTREAWATRRGQAVEDEEHRV